MITATNGKTGQVRILRRRVTSIKPSPENLKLYRPVDPADPEVIALAESIKKYGVQEPLVISADGWILSGHRRHIAAQVAGRKTVPVRVHPVRRSRDPDKFLALLREHNRQRIKSLDEKLHEEIVSANPEEAYESLIEHRAEQSTVASETIEIRGWKVRAEISEAKYPMLNAAVDVVNDYRKFWPISDRQIHYALLNDPPLRHASKPGSRYTNNVKSYKDLTDLLTRARLEGTIPWGVISDPTRPTVTWNVDNDVQSFLRKELGGFLTGYWRNLIQSQPNHIEILGEKNTIDPIIRPVGMEYCIPMTLGRGFCSLDPRHEMGMRFQKSGKERLVLLILSDFDPDGEEIAHSFARSMRDDFGIRQIEAIKVTLTADQVVEFELPPVMKAKETSVNYEKFVAANGDDVFELEALPPEDLQIILRSAIDSVLDVEAFNAEIDREKQEAAFLQGIRRTVLPTLAHLTDGDCAAAGEV